MRIRRRVGGGLLAAGCLLTLVAPAAVAQAPESAELQFRRVDSTDPSIVAVAFRYDGNEDALDDLVLEENGRAVELLDTAKFDVDYTSSFVLLFDASASTDDSAVLSEARKAAFELVDTRSADSRWAWSRPAHEPASCSG